MIDRAFRNPLAALSTEWPLLLIPVALTLLGIFTMHPFDAAITSLAPKQFLWLGLGIVSFTVCAATDMRFIRRTPVIIAGYIITLSLLVLLLVAAHAVMGAKSWFVIGPF
ncbi:FtsW/RodA/SpoVE family cell cycle protein, partial [Patescibacteria group bacterium]|nr:FtsW/RodA/SpoVE family cell cycle protein [Patescibacteria group bacterium]